MPRVKSSKARTDRYVKGLSVPSHKTKSGFRRDKSKPADENDTIFCKKGETYFYWSFPYRPVQFSLTRPRPSQLTQSEFYGSIYSLQESSDDWEVTSQDGWDELLEHAKTGVQEIMDNIEDKRGNMESEGLENVPSYETLNERYDAMEEMHGELENLEYEEQEESDLEDLEDEEKQEKIDEHIQEQKDCITEVLGNISI